MPAPIPSVRLVNRVLRQGKALGSPDLVGATSVTAEFLSPVEEQQGALVHLRFVTTGALTITLGATGARAGGVKLADLPALAIAPLAARIQCSITLTDVTATATAGEIGLGQAAGTGANATLGTTTGDEDFMTGHTLGNISAAATLVVDAYQACGSKAIVDGTSSADDIYLNYATTVGVATTNATIASGAIIDLWALCITD